MNKKYIVDISKPPIGPPIRIFRESFFFYGETKESKNNTENWKIYINEYRRNLNENRRINKSV